MPNKTPQSPKIKEGQILYTTRFFEDIEEWGVIKSGFKYLHIRHRYEDMRIDKKTLSVLNNGNGVFMQFYLTKQEVLDEIKRKRLEKKVRSEFALFSLVKKPRVFTMEELTAICGILKLN